MKTLAKKPTIKSKSNAPFFNGKSSAGFFGVQAKLNIGKPKDKFEAEADNVADKVVNNSHSSIGNLAPSANTTPVQRNTDEAIQEKPIAQTITPLIQKQEEEEAQTKLLDSVQKQEEEEVQPKLEEEKEPIQKKEEEEKVQTKAEEEEEPVQKKEEKEDETLQTKAEEDEIQKKSEEEEEPVQKQEEEEVQAMSNDTTIATPGLESNLQQSKASGSPLDGGVKTAMESSFGVDLGGVRIHTGSDSVAMNKELRAQAFTNKNDIYFNQGKFNPASKTGQHLLAHELTHTIQQGAVPLNLLKNKPEEPNLANSAVPVADSMGNPIGQNSGTSDAATPTEPEVAGTQTTDANLNEAETGNAEAETGNGLENKKAGTAEGEKKEEAIYPTSPENDPTFIAARQKIEKESTNQQTHREAAAVSQSAQDAAPSPENERESQAQSGQVEAMDQQEPGEFSAESFKAQLMERINSMQLPQNNEEADDFENNNNIKEVSEAAKQDVSSEKDKASVGIEQATAQEPDTTSIPEREIVPLPGPDLVDAPKPVGADKAMPKSRPASQVDQPLNDNMNEVNQKMAENEVTDEQLSKANEPAFSSALNSKNEAKAHTETSPAQFRQQEDQTLNASQQEAQTASENQLNGMQMDREGVMTQVDTSQNQTGTADTAERTRIANEINTIYETTKTEVELILSTLDETVSTMFTNAADRAKSKFEAHVHERMDAYKSERYSGLIGKGRWIKDKFKGLPSEVNEFFTEGRKVYIDEMDAELTLIAQHVAQKLTEAKDRISLGKQQVAEYVQALPDSLQNIGKEAAESIQSKFDELEENVNSKQDELIDSLAQQYNQSLQEVDARIEEMKAANRGLIDKALDAVVGVIKTIIQIKDTLMSILSTAISVIKTIISDPIGFLGNLISGITTGFRNFGSNILKHLTSGLIGWLTGALGPMGITIPEDIFSLKGIFSLVMQVLGLTWDYIRKKAVKLLGEPVVTALETGFEIFQIIRNEGIVGLWNYIKEQFSDLKETVIDAIKEMVITKVIEAGIKWVLGLMSPAGAFIKAAMMIIDIVKFFIERGSQIIELVKAFIDGVKAVASGSVAKVAAAIENALSKALPVVIGFLASLLGLGGLATKVQGLIKKIRKRIDAAIDKVIMKAKSWFRKAGGKVKSAAAKFFKFWKNKKSFKGTDGKNHNLFFKGEGKSAKLIVASTPTPLTTFISNAKTDGNAEKESAKNQALALSQQIDALKDTEIAGSDETAKSKKSKEIDDAVKSKMEQLVPLVNKLMGGEEKSVELLKQYLNKNVTNKDGSVNKNFINAFNSGKNKIDGKKVYVFSNNKISRSANKAKEGFMSIYISSEEANKGVLLPGAETEYVPDHTLFKPENMVLTISGGKYVATYETETRTGGGKQKFTVDIKYDQIEANAKDQNETRSVTGENMTSKPGGMQRGKTDPAGAGFDNAHLIGDQFGGSGYNQGLNIYPSSVQYNRETMLSKENGLARELTPGTPFKMTVSAQINHKIGKGSFNGNNIKGLLDSEFDAENGDKKKEVQVKEGMTAKLRASIASDLDKKKIPGQFMSVKYTVNQAGKTLPESIGADSKYDDAIKLRFGT